MLTYHYYRSLASLQMHFSLNPCLSLNFVFLTVFIPIWQTSVFFHWWKSRPGPETAQSCHALPDGKWDLQLNLELDGDQTVHSPSGVLSTDQCSQLKTTQNPSQHWSIKRFAFLSEHNASLSRAPHSMFKRQDYIKPSLPFPFHIHQQFKPTLVHLKMK